MNTPKNYDPSIHDLWVNPAKHMVAALPTQANHMIHSDYVRIAKAEGVKTEEAKVEVVTQPVENTVKKTLKTTKKGG